MSLVGHRKNVCYWKIKKEEYLFDISPMMYRRFTQMYRRHGLEMILAWEQGPPRFSAWIHWLYDQDMLYLPVSTREDWIVGR